MKRIITILAVIIVLFLIGFGIYRMIKYMRTDVFLLTEKEEYYHWEFIKLNAKIKNKKLIEIYKNEPFYVNVFKDNNKIITIGALIKIPLTYNSKKKIWEGKWPCPWNAVDGKYRAEPLVTKNIRYKTEQFIIKRRKSKKHFQKGFSVLTFENTATLSKMKMKGPDKQETDWKGLFEWTKFIGADAFWYLIGQTKAEGKKPDEHFPWVERNFSKLPEMGKEAHSRGLKFGAYIISFLTFGEYKYKNYRYAYEYNSEKGGPVETRAISLADEKRVSDIIKLVEILNNIPEVDFIGLDYIRNALGGYELVDEFVEDMNVKVPEGWGKYNSTRRMGWLANEKVSRRNMCLIDQWNWWRAHKVSKIIKRITTKVKLKKPLWVFTLTWEKGWQHGQDPVMFSDAGADIDALMLYEATREQFDMLVDEWHNYIKKDEANLVLGNVVDWPLHQRILNPPGPEEFYNRFVHATKNIYNDKIADSIFIHDLARALWGRIKPYSTEEWLIAGGAAISEMRRLNGILPVSAEIGIDSKLKIGEEFSIPIEIKNISNKKQKNISIKLHLIDGTILGDKKKYINELAPNQIVSVSFRAIVKTPAWEKDLKNMIAVQVFYDEKNATFFKYVTVR